MPKLSGVQKPKEDLRQRRSKQHMSEALLSLMEERPFRDISVVDICDRAMVHRTTFYAHFEDKNALLRYVFTELRQGFEAEQAALASQGDVRSYLLAVFQSALRFLKGHREVYLSGLAGGSPEMRLVEDGVAQELYDRLRGSDTETFPDGTEGMAVARFYAGGLMSIVRWWLENDMPISEARLVGRLSAILPNEKER